MMIDEDIRLHVMLIFFNVVNAICYGLNHDLILTVKNTSGIFST